VSGAGGVCVVDNPAWSAARPTLSVLVPFFRDDPGGLIGALDGLGDQIEIVALDDGGGDTRLNDCVLATIMGLGRPARLVSLARNEGRAAGRNRLAASARGRYLLFLDADMAPGSPAFLDAWLVFALDLQPAVAFGGFTLPTGPATTATAVHRAMAGKSDCLDARRRRLAPEKHVFTSNLLVRRDVFEAEPFDAAFTGWGWEDVEWAMRVSRRHAIAHIDNTAAHLGLDSAESLAAKYEQSVANFARVARAHRDIVRTYPSYRAARVLRRAPFLARWRPVLKAAALTAAMPVAWRALALRAYRAALYADAV
jgi:glycosyltransferase involved in cell wall biosynthesis